MGKMYMESAWELEIKDRLEKVPGFEYKVYEGPDFSDRGLAELGPDGMWRNWDQKSPYSHEALDFIVHAKPDLEMLLKLVADLRAELAESTALP